jgi:hypothetical protein
MRKENQELQERIRKEDREHQSKENKKQQKQMAEILLAGVQGLARQSSGRTSLTCPQRDRPRLDQGQCAYCKEYGHWKKECPKLQGRPGPNIRPNNETWVLLAGMDSD